MAVSATWAQRAGSRPMRSIEIPDSCYPIFMAMLTHARLAVLSDIHGNLEALSAVLADAASELRYALDPPDSRRKIWAQEPTVGSFVR